ncbi:hypothetical protein QTO34_016894 [Cnephaeus nilssonii]|uniref:Integrase catalytic domain-containing protein n=1 Tax=Cnephaeus nilssonii TaxID=3371016 RepID=A0AA40LS97_CNENI|nr:hypothetical protein QTO34_016894 [Eptesicus nilssonii]
MGPVTSKKIAVQTNCLFSLDIKEDWNAATELDRSGTTAFEELKKALVSAPALALPDITKPFHLYVNETLSPWKRPVAYLSKRLDLVAAGWPACLRAVDTTALLIKEADKQTLGQELALTTPHGVEALLRGAPERWMSNTKITQCQALLLDQPCVRFHKTLAINPASLLPDDDPEEPIHDCTEVTDAVQMARPDLTDAPLSSPDKVLFTNGSSYVQDGIRYAGAAVVTLDRTIWAQSLNRENQPFDGDTVPSPRKEGYQLQPEKTLKDISLIRGPLAPKGSSNGALQRTSEKGRQLKQEEIEPQNKNCQGSRPKTSGAFTSFSNPAGLRPTTDPLLHQNKKRNWQNRSKPSKDQMVDDRLLVPEALGRTLVAQLHQATHIGVDKVIRSIVTRSTVCAQGNSPGEHWEVDFTEIKLPASEYKYLLVLIDTFSGWVKAYPTRTETTSIVVKKLLQEIIPTFGLPVAIGSDNSPSFVAKYSSSLRTGMSRTLKRNLTKFVLESGENWTNLLPFTLLWTRCTPYQEGFPPFRDHALQYTQRATNKLVRDALPVPTTDPVHPFQPGDSVWVKFTAQGLTPT